MISGAFYRNLRLMVGCRWNFPLKTVSQLSRNHWSQVHSRPGKKSKNLYISPVKIFQFGGKFMDFEDDPTQKHSRTHIIYVYIYNYIGLDGSEILPPPKTNITTESWVERRTSSKAFALVLSIQLRTPCFFLPSKAMLPAPLSLRSCASTSGCPL